MPFRSFPLLNRPFIAWPSSCQATKSYFVPHVLCRSVGIVAEFQVKKMKKMQDEVRQEEANLQTKHLARLRAAAADAAAKDTAALNNTSGWLKGSGSEEEESMMTHWQGVLDGLWEDRVVPEGSGEVWADPASSSLPAAVAAADDQGAAVAGGGGAGGAGGGGGGSSRGAAAPGITAAVDGVRGGRAVQQQQQGAGVAAGGTRAAAECVRYRDPYHQQHHIRLTLEALRELGSMWMPSGLMIQHGAIASVRRFVSYPQLDVAQSAGRVLERWQRQLLGHLHVLSCPEYMVDGVGKLEEEIRLQRVPLPQVPRPKQVSYLISMGSAQS